MNFQNLVIEHCYERHPNNSGQIEEKSGLRFHLQSDLFHNACLDIPFIMSCKGNFMFRVEQTENIIMILLKQSCDKNIECLADRLELFRGKSF